MSTTSETASYIANLQYISGQITLYLSVVILVSGIVGNTLNCLVFSQRSLCSKPCVVYFLLASVLNLLNIASGALPRAFQSFFAIPDQSETVPALCKTRLLILFTMRTIASWLIALATVDRYLISSHNVVRRRMSNMKNTFIWIAITSVLSFLVWVEVIYCFEANMIGTPQKCYAKSDACRVFNDLAQSLVTTIIPSLVMLVAGLLTIGHIRRPQQIRPALAATNSNSVQPNRKDERSLTLMLIAQVILLTVFTLPQAAQKFYLTYTFYQTKSPSQRALESLLFNMVVLLTFIPSCMPFYLYTITGTIFRKTLIGLFKKGFNALKSCVC